ncbi:MAG: cell division protein ZapA [Myxococcales bacterium]|nr:cell division protein ZapA [Myxococcales bacterium]
MDARPVQLQVAGQSYKVVSTADEAELVRLAETVDAKVAELSAGKPMSGQTLLLAAMALAHDLESERAARDDLEKRTRDMLRRVMVRIDDALESVDR